MDHFSLTINNMNRNITKIGRLKALCKNIPILSFWTSLKSLKQAILPMLDVMDQ